MKYIYLLSLLSLLFLTACSSKENESQITQYDQIESSKMIALLTDLQLMESLINTHGNFYNKDQQNLLFQGILDKHQISRQNLDSLLLFLENNLEFYQLIMDSLSMNFDTIKNVDLPSLKYKDTVQIINKKNIEMRKKNKKIN